MKIFSSLLAGLLVLIIAAYVGIKAVVGGVNFPVGTTTVNPDSLEARIQLPEGFTFTVFANNVPNARKLRLTRRGDLLVANPNKDQVVLLKKDENGDGENDGQKILLATLNAPDGMDFYQQGEISWLYIAEQDAIGRVQFDHDKGVIVGEYTRLVKHLPDGGNHWKKNLRIGPDHLLYVAFGSSCNVCIEKDKRRATMMRYHLDGSGEEIFAKGLRNSEGFDWSPVDEHLYATDNGRDMLGDDFPPCELNKIEQGKHYGWPFLNGDNALDPDYGNAPEAMGEIFISPVHKFRAHNAPLGFVFLRHQLSSVYQHAALVALHGSWNRSKKDGYKVVSLHWREDGAIEERDFMTGFLKDDNVIGRPAEIVEADDGAIYIADDYAGAVYRVVYER